MAAVSGAADREGGEIEQLRVGGAGAEVAVGDRST